MSKPARDYVVLPKDEYEALAKGRKTAAVDAASFARSAIARNLLAARKAAKLTQGELAKKLEVSQSMISQAEQNKMRVGERYVKALLDACGLAEDWAPERAEQETRDLAEVQKVITRAFSRKGAKIRVTIVQSRSKDVRRKQTTRQRKQAERPR